LPVAFRGSSASSSSCSGIFCIITPRARMKSRTAGSVRAAAPSRMTTHAHTRSPLSRSGTPTTATSTTSGCAARSSSMLFAERFSPFRMMTSFRRPVMRT
jgi:hypothetical protein